MQMLIDGANEPLLTVACYVYFLDKPGAAIMDASDPVLIGESTVLACTATDYGVPRGEFEWRRKGEPNVIWRGNSYQPGTVHLSDNGLYECVLRNSLGTGRPAHGEITVNSK